MFNRSNPAGLALAFAVVGVMLAAFGALVAGVGATPGQDGVPAAYSFEHDHIDGRGFPALDTANYGTDIPRCASDDWNSDHVARCYTERVTDGAVLIIDASDTVIATLNK